MRPTTERPRANGRTAAYDSTTTVIYFGQLGSIARGARLCWIRRRDATRARRICESAKSQGMVMLHSDTLTEGREGRASEALEEREACPGAAAKKC